MLMYLLQLLIMTMYCKFQVICMYPWTKFLYFKQINPLGSSLLLNTHEKKNGFLPFEFTMILLIIIHLFLDRNFFTSEIADIFHIYPFGLVISSFDLSGPPVSVEIDVSHAHWINSSSCSTKIGITLVYLVTLYFTSMTGSCIIGIVWLYEVSNFLSEFNTLSYSDMSMLASFVWYIHSDEFKF